MGEHPRLALPGKSLGGARGQARRGRSLGGEVICTGASQAMTHLQIRDLGASLLLS